MTRNNEQINRDTFFWGPINKLNCFIINEFFVTSAKQPTYYFSWMEQQIFQLKTKNLLSSAYAINFNARNSKSSVRS
jgi:hypothetical protein